MRPVCPLAVSAVIPTYNRAHLLARAIDSAVTALGPGDEVIVVDDGSTDGTVALVEGYGGPVRLLRVDHGGAGAARNAGYAAARGPLVAFLDSDDEWFTDKIELQRSFMEARPYVLYCCGDFGVRTEDGRELRRSLPLWLDHGQSPAAEFGPGVLYSTIASLPAGRADFPVYVGDLYLEEMRNGFIAAFTAIVRKPEAGDDLGFAEDLPTCEEWPAFGRLAGRGAGALFDTELAWQHGHDGPRLTEASMDVWADAWGASLRRVWGADPDFLAAHGDDYERALADARMVKAVALARAGGRGRAKAALAVAARDPRGVARLGRRLLGRRRAAATIRQAADGGG
jgi:glycosyltransferase involved in cell wall biosynthesis